LTFCKTDTTTGQVLILDSGRLLSYWYSYYLN